MMDKDREIAMVRDCQKGDRKALGELVKELQKPIYNAAYRMLGNPDDAFRRRVVQRHAEAKAVVTGFDRERFAGFSGHLPVERPDTLRRAEFDHAFQKAGHDVSGAFINDSFSGWTHLFQNIAETIFDLGDENRLDEFPTIGKNRVSLDDLKE